MAVGNPAQSQNLIGFKVYCVFFVGLVLRFLNLGIVWGKMIFSGVITLVKANIERLALRFL